MILKHDIWKSIDVPLEFSVVDRPLNIEKPKNRVVFKINKQYGLLKFQY